ncbi:MULTISPECIES: Na(+)/H(+) antiporter subunit F1 [unclassified Planococcus (in: firmicutes)]|uniref:Na(+)/H(+) antiporter subunit F1 n=1 Tax=unclassified Planococcus (in: firmicutes) TaxID=2662419 RepID=UPI000C324986|nr:MULTISPECIES: Na(+)/H(+) antiporter subunit F1 [unclassified Planococcus (in: firmicutes)]AUD13518.1 Na(+)/H(+) antiporter subunit F [Planococcus sp. MB-3u-03]PKG46054.1 Na(+)/H(+) antiporter subunit F [Planococcus sp. Urea-trap-24]PKG89957.1 Na(+)/H(+) antiporter subunit F [Planococcus sp. Urea-3u-39]PKH40578.1 Na(+)/H(+) antiporter subunit F [Planococcus sp. MB-3u-09]
MIMFYWIALMIVSFSFAGLLFRLVKGPTVADRVVALDAIGVTLVSIVALLSLIIETEFFLEVVLLMSILSFIGTAAFAKFLERGEIFDRDPR